MLDDIQEALDLFSQQREGVLKVALYPQGSPQQQTGEAVTAGALDEQC